MPQIFVSHSRYDEQIRDFFDRAFAGTTVRAVRLEFEEFTVSPSAYIMDQVRNSDALFVLLGPNVIRSSYTQGWIGFEIGLAAATYKHIWVFEPFEHTPIQFPVPLLHHYMLYSVNSIDHLRYISSIIKAYEPIIPLFRDIPRGYAKITCPYGDCRMSYVLHTRVDKFYCPVCRRQVSIHER